MKFAPLVRITAASTLIALFATQPAFGWGRDGHKMVNRIAAQYLPADVPAFLRNGNAVDTIEYLGPEPDRWHSKTEAQLRDDESPDHFLNMEQSAHVGGLPNTRPAFAAAVAKAAAAHPELKLSVEEIGTQPWAVQDAWQKLKVDMREYRRLLAANADTTPVQTAILYDCGILGHYVGDGAQPLHTTIQYNGWTGANPNGYTVEHTIHSRFESDFVKNSVNRDAEVAPLVAATKPVVISDEWTQYLDYLNHTSTFVEKVYQIDKAHGFDGAGTPEAHTLVAERIAAGAIELRDLIYSAWVASKDSE